LSVGATAKAFSTAAKGTWQPLRSAKMRASLQATIRHSL
jgi:hypothetical protein